MKPDDFETRLTRQPVKQIPGEWRAEILAAAREEQAVRHSSFVIRHSWLSTLDRQLSALLWPHPKAWVGLAAVWMLIFAVNFSLRETSPLVMAKSAPPSPEVIVELKKQQRLFAELVGATEAPDVDRPKIFLPKPRSDVVEILMT